MTEGILQPGLTAGVQNTTLTYFSHQIDRFPIRKTFLKNRTWTTWISLLNGCSFVAGLSALWNFLPKKNPKKQSPDLIHCYVIGGVISKWHLQKEPFSWVSEWKTSDLVPGGPESSYRTFIQKWKYSAFLNQSYFHFYNELSTTTLRYRLYSVYVWTEIGQKMLESWI